MATNPIYATQTATIDAGATLELVGADSESITFSGSTGTLVLDQSTLFTGELINLTGDGNPSSSDQIDLKDIAFGSGTTESYAGNSSGGVLTVTDAQNHTTSISLVGNYTNSTFALSSDGHGGTTVIDPPVTPFALGVDVGNPNANSPSEEAAFEANFNAFSTLMGAKPQYLDQYGNQNDPISQWVGQASWDAASVAQSPVLKNVTPVIGLPMSSTAPGSGTPDQFYQAFAAGTYDSVLQGMVKAWANSGFTSQIWRPGWEMNVSSMPSYAGNDAATQADWIKAFQHISTVLHAAGQADGVNVQVMWNANVQNYSNAGNVIQTAYPGNQYVDIIGADVYGDLYPYGSPTHLYDWDKSGQVLNSPNPVYDTSLQQWAADPINLLHYYTDPASNQWSLDGSVGHATTLQELIDLAKSTGKPLAIAETGAGNTADGAGVADNPTFMQWLSQTLQQSGVPISFVNIWDSNGGGNYEFSNAADGKPLEAAAWAKYFGAASVPAPTLASFSPDSNVVGDGITNVNHLTLTGTAVAGGTVGVFDGTTEIGTATADGSGAWSFATATLADGSHAFTSKAMDGAGNVSAASAALNVTIETVAPNAPAVSSFSPDSNVVGDGITNVNHVTLAGTAVVGSTVEVFDGTTEIGTATADASGAWSFATATLTDGTHAFTSKAMDAAGNVSATSAALNVTIETVAPNAPAVSSFSPDSNVVGDGITNVNHVTLTGTAVVGSTVEVFDGPTEIGTAIADASGAWSFATATLADGSHAFTAKATDVAGNVSAASAALNVKVDTIAPNAPNIISDAAASATASIISGTAEAGSMVKLFEGTTFLGTGMADSGGIWNINTGSLSPGAHNLTATATDVAGNVSNISNALDPVIGAVIEAFGSTSLVKVGTNFYLDNNSTQSAPELKYGGVAFTAGQFGAWAPCGVEQTAGGYDVAWKAAGADQYIVWSTDSSGNYIANLTGTVSGNSNTLEALETTLHQDLNGDGTIGLAVKVIESSGSTGLSEVGTNFFFSSNGTAPELKYGGAAFTAGQFGAWAPIGVEQTAGGYDVAWKAAGADQYIVWSTDSSGNYIANLTGTVSGNSNMLEALETTMHQDLNGDGTIGLAVKAIESSGSTGLSEVGTNFFFSSNGTAPELKYGGAAFTAGQFGAWAPIGVEQTAGGYDVAWKAAGADQYIVWSTDSSGNYIANLTGTVSGNSSTLKALETTLHQDLNGDGIIDTPATVIEATGSVQVTLSHMTQAATIDAGATLELTGADSGSVTFSGATGTLVLDHSSLFTGKLINLTGDGNPSSSDQIDLKDIAFGSGTTYSYAGNSAGGILTISDAQNHTANISLVGNYTNSTFTLSSDGHGGTIAIDPPKDNFAFASIPVPVNAPTTPSVTVGSAGIDGFVFHQPTGGNFGSQSGSAHDGFALNTENSHLLALASDAQSDHHWIDAGRDVGGHVISPIASHFAEVHAGDYMIH